MRETEELLRSHFSLYPGMEPEDGVKLLYQGSFGMAPAEGDGPKAEASFLAALCAELDGPDLRSPAPEPPGQVPVGDGLCRVALSTLAAGPAPETFARLCLQAARGERGGAAALEAGLARLAAMARAGTTPWPAAEVERFLAGYRAQGCPPLRHSARYRALYRPHYRLLDEASARLLPVYAAIDRALAQKPHCLVGIDGMSGAGKSRLAAALAEVYGCRVVHADDFFLRPGQRSSERLAEAGGNIDYERLGPVALLAADDRPFEYAPYDCRTGELGPPRRLPAARLTVLEGVYALHPAVAAPCDVRVFLGTDAMVQRERLRRRDPALWPRFESEWLPMESRYFAGFGIRESCDVVVDTGGLG